MINRGLQLLCRSSMLRAIGPIYKQPLRAFSRLLKFKYDLPERLILPEMYMKFIKDHTRILDDIDEQVVTDIYSALYFQQITWIELRGREWISRKWYNELEKEDEVESYIMKTAIPVEPSKQTASWEVYLRINSFPDEPLYTVISDDIELTHINDFPKNWHKK